MQQNRVKRIMREGGLALGTHVGGIPDPQIVEIIGLAGFDAAFIDMEHTTLDLHDVQACVMAAERMTSLVAILTKDNCLRISHPVCLRMNAFMLSIAGRA